MQISTLYCRTQIYCIRTNMLITTFASLHGEIYRQCYEIFDSNLDQSAQPVLLMKTRVSVWRTFLVCKNICQDGILAVKRHLRLNKILYTCKRNGFRVQITKLKEIKDVIKRLHIYRGKDNQSLISAMRGLYRKVRIDIAEEERRKIVEKNEKVILRQTGE